MAASNVSQELSSQGRDWVLGVNSVLLSPKYKLPIPKHCAVLLLARTWYLAGRARSKRSGVHWFPCS